MNLMEWNLLYQIFLDRINWIFRIFFDRFPEENGKAYQPSATEIIMSVGFALCLPSSIPASWLSSLCAGKLEKKIHFIL